MRRTETRSSAARTAAPPYRYLVIGAGRQGTAAAYDLARFGEAARIVLADREPAVAADAAGRVNRLTGTSLAAPLTLDVKDEQAVQAAVQGMDVVLSAVPYYFNLAITRAAVAAGAHYCDLGGNTAIVRAQMALGPEAHRAGVSIVPDCGMGPGLVNTLGAYVIQLLEERSAEPREVYVYDAGLPQDPVPPWNYQLSFHINGLTNEMDGEAIFIRDGEIARVPTLSEPEPLDFPGLGRLEADVTSGGTSTAAWTYLGKLERFENKVMRYPGHYEWLRAYKALGLFSEQPVEVDGASVIPRHLYHTLLEPKISSGSQVRDVCVMRAVGKGVKAGETVTVTVDLVDRYDEATGFSGMERLTGWHASVMMGFQARGRVAAGAAAVELAVPAGEFMEALGRRGIRFEVR